MFSFSWFMLPLGIALGLYWARLSARPKDQAEAEPAAWMATPPQAGTANLDLQLMLGGLLRKQGETDQALQLHQRLLAQPGLSPQDSSRIRYEMALDHVRAGVIDRAESLLEQLLSDGRLQLQSLELLLQVQEQAREWRKAMETARKIEAHKSQSQKPLLAHYLCELADEAQRRKEPVAVIALAEEAIATDAACVRAYLILGAHHVATGDYRAAIKIYGRVAEKTPRYLGEVLPAMERCHEALNSLDTFDQFLADTEARSAHPDIAIIRARRMKARGEDAIGYLAGQLEKNFSPNALDRLLELLATQPAQPQAIVSLRNVMQATLAPATAYCCERCGFRPRTLFWQCPSCRQWGSVVPLLKLN